MPYSFIFSGKYDRERIMKKKVLIENRRQVLKKGASLISVSVCGSVFPALMTGCEKDTLKSTGKTVKFDVSSVDSLKTVDGVIMETFGKNNNGKPVIILRTGEEEFVVLTSVCTYEGCQVNLPVTSGADIVCPCCRSIYSSKDGSLIKGPSTAPLRSFKTAFNQEKNILEITF